MKLKSFSVKHYGWELDNLTLQDLNLIVGRNAVGKSRTIATLDLLVEILLQQGNNELYNTSWKIEFESDPLLVYHIYYQDNHVNREYICYKGEDVLIREGGETKIKSSKTNDWQVINPPMDKLVLHVRRDTDEYPFLENIIKWAENTYGLSFGKITPSWFPENKYVFDLFSYHESIVEMFETLNDSEKQNIIDSFNYLGYNIVNISVYTIYDIHKGLKQLVLREEGVAGDIYEIDISQGMLRSLYLFIFIKYIANKKDPQLLVIDDLCEGLDYQRATVLGKIVFDLCKEKNIQLIASSNDGFLMDVVDIDYWNVLQRKGSVVTSINKLNSPKLFEDFKFTGLSNFDFFASNYLDQNNS